MADLKESIIESIKGFLLPELGKLQDGINELRTRMDSVEKQIVIMNENISDNSRRIDTMGGQIVEMGARLDGRIDAMGGRLDGRIDAMGGQISAMGGQIVAMGNAIGGRIDAMGARLDERIDAVYTEFEKVRIEMERLKRDEAITADILHRMEIIEERVLLGG